LLQTKKITLISPEKWDDGNDRHFMGVYKERMKLKTLLAICLARDSDTYAHWKVFSPNSDGVCMVLNKELLLRSFDGIPGIRHDEVEYREIRELQSDPPFLARLPFIKRIPYRPEGEFRVLYESEDEIVGSKAFALPDGCIEAVVLSPWMPDPLVESVKKTLKSIEGCGEVRMYQSTLIRNELWANISEIARDLREQS
jgi:hypothetical protein